MVAQFVDDLHLPLSKLRLGSYRSGGDSDLRMIASYFWDMELSAAILPALHAVELALRNRIHGALSRVHGTEMWFYTPGVLEPGQLRELASALMNIDIPRISCSGPRVGEDTGVIH